MDPSSSTKTSAAPTETTLNASESPVVVLEKVIEPLIAPLGYELVHLEVQNQRQKILRLFIDRAAPGPDREASQPAGSTGVGIEDCIKVTRALDEPLENHPGVDSVFNGPYELEVSSPGVDRPLRQERDFIRFTGRQIRLHTFRPLSGSELSNEDYSKKNSKQKNFLGVIEGVEASTEKSAPKKLILRIERELSKKELKELQKQQKKDPSAEVPANGERVTVPLELISKANLEPRFDFDKGDQE